MKSSSKLIKIDIQTKKDTKFMKNSTLSIKSLGHKKWGIDKTCKSEIMYLKFILFYRKYYDTLRNILNDSCIFDKLHKVTEELSSP